VAGPVTGAEKQELGKNPPPLNHYRKVLVSEVLPTVMAAEKEGDLKFTAYNFFSIFCPTVYPDSRPNGFYE
jgi:hypothetical protein